MLHILRLTAALTLCLALGSSGHAQTPPTLSFGASVDSSYPLGSSTFGSVQYAISITIHYSSNLLPNQFISQSQLSADYQAFVLAYPSPQDPVEAILQSAANSFSKKYPQFDILSLEADATSPQGPTVGGVQLRPQIIAIASSPSLTGFASPNLSRSNRFKLKQPDSSTSVDSAGSGRMY
jgi:hypothetical protein